MANLPFIPKLLPCLYHWGLEKEWSCDIILVNDMSAGICWDFWEMFAYPV